MVPFSDFLPATQTNWHLAISKKEIAVCWLVKNSGYLDQLPNPRVPSVLSICNMAIKEYLGILM